jgi:hypothetical protein
VDCGPGGGPGVVLVVVLPVCRRDSGSPVFASCLSLVVFYPSPFSPP